MRALCETCEICAEANRISLNVCSDRFGFALGNATVTEGNDSHRAISFPGVDDSPNVNSDKHQSSIEENERQKGSVSGPLGGENEVCPLLEVSISRSGLRMAVSRRLEVSLRPRGIVTAAEGVVAELLAAIDGGSGNNGDSNGDSNNNNYNNNNMEYFNPYTPSAARRSKSGGGMSRSLIVWARLAEIDVAMAGVQVRVALGPDAVAVRTGGQIRFAADGAGKLSVKEVHKYA